MGDMADRWLFRAGGVAALMVVAGYLATFPIYAVVGGPAPSGAEAHLAHYGAHLAGWWGILGLMVFTDIVYVVAWFALFKALGYVNRNLGLLALICPLLFVVLDLAVTWPNHAVLFSLAKDFAASTERAPLIAAAMFPTAVVESPVPAVYAILFPSVGPFLAGLAMWKGRGLGRFSAVVAFLVGATAVLAIAAPFISKSLEMMHVVNALLVTLWLGLAGAWLVRLGRG